MSSDFQGWEPPPPPPPPVEPAATGGSTARVVGIALAIAAFGAIAGFAVTHAASPTFATTAASSTPNPSPSEHRPSFGPRDGSGFSCRGGFDGAAFGGGFCGGETGTVTKISGSTLTLRTLAGTVTVTTSSATTYSREEQKTAFRAIKVGDVVAVRGSRSGTTKTATSPIAATAITIEVPSILGRVQSVNGNTVTLVTGDGQLESIRTSSATSYHGVRGATATSASLKAGVYIVAQGTRVNLTMLDADNIEVLGNMSFTPHDFPHTGPLPSMPAGAQKPA